MQRGRDELVLPVTRSASAATFELVLDTRTQSDGSTTLRGPEVQGKPGARFVYINSGTYAGQSDSPWGRRAKVSLTGLSDEMLASALARPGSVIQATIDGHGRDGGPAAATVPLLDGGWHVVG